MAKGIYVIKIYIFREQFFHLINTIEFNALLQIIAFFIVNLTAFAGSGMSIAERKA